MTGDEPLDLRGADTLATPVDHLLDTAGECDESFFIDLGHVSSPEEPVLSKYRFVFLWVVVIARKYTGALQDQFPLFIGGELITLRINDLIRVIRACGSPHGGTNGL